MSEVVPFIRPNDRAMMLELANKVEVLWGTEQESIQIPDDLKKSTETALASLTGRVIALEARIARQERETAPRAFSDD